MRKKLGVQEAREKNQGGPRIKRRLPFSGEKRPHRLMSERSPRRGSVCKDQSWGEGIRRGEGGADARCRSGTSDDLKKTARRRKKLGKRKKKG